MMSRFDTTEVWLPLKDIHKDSYTKSGTLHIHETRLGLNTTFSYDETYLKTQNSWSFDPAYELYAGTQHHPAGGFAGAISDAMPDRWGRHLIQRTNATPLNEAAYLLAISDKLRIGALRFKHAGSDFLAPNTKTSIPPVTELSRLSCLSEKAEKDPAFKELQDLTEAGSSLGGARPKVNVLDASRKLLIAKLSSIKDDYSTIAWEYVALKTAEMAGINIPEINFMRIGGRPILLLDRFDRELAPSDNLKRIPYMSAMTLLQLKDGDTSSYAAISRELNFLEDRHELYRRAVYGYIIGNTDDHLRNHGLLRKNNEWRLSPAFDINPGTKKRLHATPISTIHEDTPEAILQEAQNFSLEIEEAKTIIHQVLDAIPSWQKAATEINIPLNERKLFAPEFEGERFKELKTFIEA